MCRELPLGFQYLLILDKYNKAKLRWFAYRSDLGQSGHQHVCVSVCVLGLTLCNRIDLTPWFLLETVHFCVSLVLVSMSLWICRSVCFCVCSACTLDTLAYLRFKHQSTVVLSYLISCIFPPITIIAVWLNYAFSTLVSCFNVCGSCSANVLVI